MASKFLQNLSAEQKDLNLRIFNLVIGRVLKRAYLNFDEKGREEAERVFLFGDNKEVEEFVKKHIPNFKKFFGEEAKKLKRKLR